MTQFHRIFFWYFPFYLLVHKHTTFFIFMGKCSREKYREIESFDFTIFLVLDILEFSDLLCIMKRSQRKLVSYTSFGFWELPTCSSDTFGFWIFILTNVESNSCIAVGHLVNQVIGDSTLHYLFAFCIWLRQSHDMNVIVDCNIAMILIVWNVNTHWTLLNSQCLYYISGV